MDVLASFSPPHRADAIQAVLPKLVLVTLWVQFCAAGVFLSIVGCFTASPALSTRYAHALVGTYPTRYAHGLVGMYSTWYAHALVGIYPTQHGHYHWNGEPAMLSKVQGRRGTRVNSNKPGSNGSGILSPHRKTVNLSFQHVYREQMEFLLVVGKTDSALLYLA